jgi:hypothetical protein
MSEHQEQSALFSLLKYNETKYPFLKYIFAIPNGGARHIAVARKLKAEGVKKGTWDIFVPIPSHNHSGLFIEMKHGKNKLSGGQKDFGEYVNRHGYATSVCYSAKDAAKAIESYLDISLTVS